MMARCPAVFVFYTNDFLCPWKPSPTTRPRPRPFFFFAACAISAPCCGVALVAGRSTRLLFSFIRVSPSSPSSRQLGGLAT